MVDFEQPIHKSTSRFQREDYMSIFEYQPKHPVMQQRAEGCITCCIPLRECPFVIEYDHFSFFALLHNKLNQCL